MLFRSGGGEPGAESGPGDQQHHADPDGTGPSRSPDYGWSVGHDTSHTQHPPFQDCFTYILPEGRSAFMGNLQILDLLVMHKTKDIVKLYRKGKNVLADIFIGVY